MGEFSRGTEQARSGWLSGSGKTLQEELDVLLHCQRYYWYQRAKVKWIQLWDSNTRFFHSWASKRKGYNFITQWRTPAGEWLSDPQELQSLILSHIQGILRDESLMPTDMGKIWILMRFWKISTLVFRVVKKSCSSKRFQKMRSKLPSSRWRNRKLLALMASQQDSFISGGTSWVAKL